MKPRVTMNLRADGGFELWLNEEGRDLLIRELQALNESNDHFHLMPFEWWDGAEVDLSLKAYRDTDKLIGSGKILFRTDEGDRAHYPHVLGDLK